MGQGSGLGCNLHHHNQHCTLPSLISLPFCPPPPKNACSPPLECPPLPPFPTPCAVQCKPTSSSWHRQSQSYHFLGGDQYRRGSAAGPRGGLRRGDSPLREVSGVCPSHSPLPCMALKWSVVWHEAHGGRKPLEEALLLLLCPLVANWLSPQPGRRRPLYQPS